MPVPLSYPGVYIEEIPSGVHTIVGVPTSITAFVGTAPKGPDNIAVPIGSLLQYERVFGALDASPLGIAAKLYFQNGGSQALVVRVKNPNSKAATLTLPRGTAANPPTLTALSLGAWARNLAARVDVDGITDQTSYNLTIRDRSPGGRTERYAMVSTVAGSPRTLDRLLKSSTLVSPVVDNPLVMPGPHDRVDRGTDPFIRQLPPPQPPPSLPASSTKSDDGTPTPPATRTTPPAAGPGPFSPFVLDSGADPDPTDPGDYAPSSGESGIYALTEHNAFFNMLIVVPPGPDDVSGRTLAEAAKIAYDKRAILIVDSSNKWNTIEQALDGRDGYVSEFGELGRRNSALYYPRLVLEDLGHTASQTINVDSFPAASTIAGVYARTDTERGIWKAPAGLATGIAGATGLTDVLTDFDCGMANPVAINALRTLPIVGNVVWGARTLVGSDLEASQWKYIPVRRTALYIEESLYRGTQWVVFEPNDEPLWSQIRLNVGTFMHTMFLQGAFQGATAREAYFVKCDKDTTLQEDIDRGIVNIIVGFAPLKPAEFVVIQLQQITPQTFGA
jgi:phage tail sheath protein FI